MAIPNTAFGLSIFPVLYTIVPGLSLLSLMIIAHVLAVLFSYTTQSLFTFRSTLTAVKFLKFLALNLFSLFLCYGVTLLILNLTTIDVRLIQPIVALFIQISLIPFYRLILPTKKYYQMVYIISQTMGPNITTFRLGANNGYYIRSHSEQVIAI